MKKYIFAIVMMFASAAYAGVDAVEAENILAKLSKGEMAVVRIDASDYEKWLAAVRKVHPLVRTYEMSAIEGGIDFCFALYEGYPDDEKSFLQKKDEEADAAGVNADPLETSDDGWQDEPDIFEMDDIKEELFVFDDETLLDAVSQSFCMEVIEKRNNAMMQAIMAFRQELDKKTPRRTPTTGRRGQHE